MTLSLAYFKVILNLHILLRGISVDSCQPLEPAMVGARTRNASQQSKLFSVIFPKKYIIKGQELHIWQSKYDFPSLGPILVQININKKYMSKIDFESWFFWIMNVYDLAPATGKPRPWEKFADNVCAKIHR